MELQSWRNITAEEKWYFRDNNNSDMGRPDLLRVALAANPTHFNGGKQHTHKMSEAARIYRKNYYNYENLRDF